MFSKTITNTDNFIDMPPSAQNLYFHLGMNADDDGFVTPKMIMKMLGSVDDDLRILIAKNYVYPFESGVIVIRHWKENNYIQADRYRATLYQEELKKACENNVYILDTQDRLGKDRLGKRRIGNSSCGKNWGKPFYRGQEMREKPKGKWWVLPNDGSAWLEFAGQEKDIEFK
jgi:hypothetical protein